MRWKVQTGKMVKHWKYCGNWNWHMQILETHDIIQQPREIKRGEKIINATIGTTSLYIEYKFACMYRCGMHCLSPVFMSKVIDDRCLHCRFSIFFTNSTTWRLGCTLLLVTIGLTWPYKDVFWDQTKNFGKQNPILIQFWVLQDLSLTLPANLKT